MACLFSLWRHLPVRTASTLSGVNTLFGAERWRTASSGAHTGVDEFALHETTSRLRTRSYDNMVPPKVWCLDFWTRYNIVVASSRPAATSYHTTQTRRRRCALPMMASSMFGAKQRISEPLSALAFPLGAKGQ